MKNRVFFFAFALLLFSACEKEDALVQSELNEQSSLTGDPSVTSRNDATTAGSGNMTKGGSTTGGTTTGTSTTSSTEKVVLSMNQSATLSSGIKASITGISDNRCPTGTLCTSSGNAVVGFVFQSTEGTYGMKLGTSTTDPNYTNSGVIFDKYVVTVLDVSPHPQNGTEVIPQESYQVTIGVQMK